MIVRISTNSFIIQTKISFWNRNDLMKKIKFSNTKKNNFFFFYIFSFLQQQFFSDNLLDYYLLLQ